LIDPFLRPVIAALEDHILQNALVQYFQPYNSASFSRMLASFGQEDENSRNDLASKLAMLIKTGRLQARLDLVEMVSCLETADWAHDG
jgi:COP9 signalosome complex subunit 1